MEFPHEQSYKAVIRSVNEYAHRREPFLFIVDFAKEHGYFIPSPLDQKHIRFCINGETNAYSEHTWRPLSLTRHPLGYDEYREKYEVVLGGLKRGDSFLCNLTVPTDIDIDASLDEIFEMTEARYKVLVPGRFICFSPEIFITIDNKGQISSHPMKGTIDASLPDASETILNDYKETSEHCTIVDLIRNDLNIVAQQVRVESFRYIDEVKVAEGKSILQVSSKVVGDLPDHYLDCLGDVIDVLLPAGSICGAPKAATVDLIRRAETTERGYYTGIVGYFDGSTLDTGVLIRYIEERQGGSKVFRSGGGITINSNPMDEYAEVIQKVYIPTR